MADIQSREIRYQAGDTDMRGYPAWDAARHGPRPGVLAAAFR